MIKITLYPTSKSLTANQWTFVKAIFDHINETKADTFSLTDYAVKFSTLSKNIELERAFVPQYLDDMILLYASADWAIRDQKQAPVIAQIEKGPKF